MIKSANSNEQTETSVWIVLLFTVLKWRKIQHPKCLLHSGTQGSYCILENNTLNMIIIKQKYAIVVFMKSTFHDLRASYTMFWSIFQKYNKPQWLDIKKSCRYQVYPEYIKNYARTHTHTHINHSWPPPNLVRSYISEVTTNSCVRST